jgi:hypothetical protein
MAIVSDDPAGHYNPRRSQGPLGHQVEEAEPVPWKIARTHTANQTSTSEAYKP